MKICASFIFILIQSFITALISVFLRNFDSQIKHHISVCISEFCLALNLDTKYLNDFRLQQFLEKPFRELISYEVSI